MKTQPWKATGQTLTVMGLMLGCERIRRYKRTWWTLWLCWRDENDTEFRARINEHLRNV